MADKKINIGLNLTNALKQELRLNPMLIQTMKLLELNSLELKEEIKKELEENPFLEEEENNSIYDAYSPEIPRINSNVPDVDMDYIDYYNNNDEAPENDVIENTLTEEKTLEEHLKEQIDLIFEKEIERNIAYFIIGNLDNYGFLTLSTYDIYMEFKKNNPDVTPDLVEKIRQKIMLLDPIGCGAFNSKEALLIQIKIDEGENSLLYKMVKEYWDDILHLRYEVIAAALKIDEKEVKDLIFSLKKYEIYPGRQYQLNASQIVVPDVIVFLNNEDKVVIIVTDGDIPRFKINYGYYEKINNSKFFTKKQIKNMMEKFEKAKYLIKGIYQRRHSIYIITKAIFEVQKDFLKVGIKGLKPLKLSEIAEKTGLHESTVSRITKNKYVQTPKGIFQLKYFFSKGMGEDEDISTKIIKNHLKEIIANETSEHIYSDQELADILMEKYGISIARRTVAKYREQLGIPKKSLRKRKKL